MPEKKNHVVDWLPAYTLGSLEAEEKQQVEQHLSECAACRKELRSYQAVMAQIPLAAREYAPPPQLRTAILRQVEGRPHPSPAAPAASPRRPWYAPLLQLNRQPLWGIVSLLLIFGLLVSNLLLWQRLQQLQSPRSDHFIQVPLAGTGSLSTASGLIVISANGRYGTLVADELPTLDPSQQYQLWLIRDDQRTDGGTFSVEDSGYAVHYIHSSEPLLQYTAFGVTVEPAGGSPGPTGEKVLGGSF